MKRMLAAGSITALAMVGFAANASAAPSPNACFGQVHKIVNTQGYEGFENVGQLVKALGGQGKNAAATGLVESGICDG
jgi:hypothetical protein